MPSKHRPTLVTPPAETPVTAAEVRAQCAGATSSDDTLIATLIGAAVGTLDGYHGTLGRCLVSQTWAQTFDHFDSRLCLPFPALSVASVTYLDADGAEQTASTSLYALRHDALGSYVALRSGQSWPSTYCEAEAVTVTFVAGYGDAGDVPSPIRQAIILMASRMFHGTQKDATLVTDRSDGVGTFQWDNSGALAQAADQTVAALVGPFRRVGL